MLSRKIVESLERLRASNEAEEVITIESILEEDAKKRAASDMLLAEEEARRQVLREKAEAKHAASIEAVRAARRETELDRADIVKNIDQVIQAALQKLAADLRSLAADEDQIIVKEEATERAAQILGMSHYYPMNRNLPSVLARSVEDIAATPTSLTGFKRYLTSRNVVNAAAVSR